RRDYGNFSAAQRARHHSHHGDARTGHRRLRATQCRHARRCDSRGPCGLKTHECRSTASTDIRSNHLTLQPFNHPMRIAPTFNVAYRALRRNKMRSVLTALGIIIGVGAVIAMVGIGNGAKAQVEGQIASLGENVILIFSGSTTSSGIRTGWGGAGTLKIEDAEAIRREVPGVIAVSEEVVTTTQVAAGNQNWFTRIYGESADYFDIRQWPLADGTPFTDQDVRSANKICVIGRTTASQIYGNDDPVGQILRIKNVPFTICGVLTPKGLSTQGVDQDDIVIMPYSSAMKRVSGGTTLRNINVQVGQGG